MKTMTKYIWVKKINPLRRTLLKNLSRSRQQLLTLGGTSTRAFTVGCCCRSQSGEHVKWTQPSGYNTGILIYNPLVKEKVPLIIKQERILKWYACGPTVYDSAHIGHASSYIRQDVVRRIIERAFGIDCILVMGMTDVDDKIIVKAKETKRPIQEITSFYEAEFLRDMSQLNVLPASIITRVTDHIPVITDFIEGIEEQGYAYKTVDGSVYFDVDGFGQYGLFSNPLKNESFQDYTGVKKSPKDFALWKSSKQGDPKWPSRWGEGRPGWHIECSAMASSILGSNFDIHSGGEDLLFPHHENEHTQSCAYHQTSQWVNYWLHTGRLHLAGQDDKMSKSLKNTISVSEFLENYTANHLRMLSLLTSYRKRIVFSDERVNKAVSTVKQFNNFITKCDAYVKGQTGAGNISESEFYQRLDAAKTSVFKAYADDFNTPQALATMMRFIKFANQAFGDADGEKSSTPTTSSVRSPALMCAVSKFIQHHLDLLGIEIAQRKGAKSSNLKRQFDDVIELAVSSRNKIRDVAKDKKNFFEIAAELDIPKEKAAILMKKSLGSLWNVADDIRVGLLKNADIEIRDGKERSEWSVVERRTERNLLNARKTEPK